MAGESLPSKVSVVRRDMKLEDAADSVFKSIVSLERVCQFNRGWSIDVSGTNPAAPSARLH